MDLSDITEDHRIIFRVVAHQVGMLTEPSHQRETCQVMEEAEADLIKVLVIYQYLIDPLSVCITSRVI